MDETNTFLHGCKKLRSFKRSYKEKNSFPVMTRTMVWA